MEHPYKLRRAAKSVDAARIICIILGALSMLSIMPFLFSDKASAFTALVSGISLFITAGLLNGLTQIVQACSVYLETKANEWNEQKALEEAQRPNEREIQ